MCVETGAFMGFLVFGTNQILRAVFKCIKLKQKVENLFYGKRRDMNGTINKNAAEAGTMLDCENEIDMITFDSNTNKQTHDNTTDGKLLMRKVDLKK